MRNADIEALGDLAGEAAAAGGTLIRQVHEGIAGRPFGILDPAAAPVRVLHDGVSGAVYGGVWTALRAASKGGVRLLAMGSDRTAPPLASLPAGSVVLGALNGMYGDHLHVAKNDLALSMEVRRAGMTVAITPTGLAEAFLGRDFAHHGVRSRPV